MTTVVVWVIGGWEDLGVRTALMGIGGVVAVRTILPLKIMTSVGGRCCLGSICVVLIVAIFIVRTIEATSEVDVAILGGAMVVRAIGAIVGVAMVAAEMNGMVL